MQIMYHSDATMGLTSLTYFNQSGERVIVSSIPQDIKDLFTQIETYVGTLKTAEELLVEEEKAKVEEALIFITQNATDEQKLTLINIYPDWIPVGKEYPIGYEFKYLDKLYKVLQAHTSQADWLPDTVPALYKVITPPDVIPDFVPPTGAHDVYMIGDKVLFNGVVYESTIDNNSWSPIDYPAGWKVV